MDIDGLVQDTQFSPKYSHKANCGMSFMSPKFHLHSIFVIVS